MARLYPPYIEGTLPAFCLDEKGNGEIAIPFTFNKAVSSADIVSFAVRIKTVQNDALLGDINIAGTDRAETREKVSKTAPGYWALEESRGGGIVHLKVEEGKIQGIKLTVGQFYKIQLAFKDEKETVGYYSTVGVVKCTSKPDVYIDGFELTKANNNNTEFVGVFSQRVLEDSEYSGDITEKVYSCNFKIYNEDKEIVYESGEMAHSVENNVAKYQSEDHWHFFRELESGKVYTIKYTVTTNNNLVVSSPEYVLVEQRSVPNGFKTLAVRPHLVKDDGYIAVSLYAEEPIAGMFVLSRADMMDPTYWMELTRFGCHGEIPTECDVVFRDFTIEQGKTYIYRVRRYNLYNIYSDPIDSEKIYADFDDMFIYDGKRQLRVEFNPQMSSFKTQLAESRSETIGGKYPFFFRNARVGYKIFPVSGLISMQMDESELFTTYEEILRTDYSRRRGTSSNSGIGAKLYGEEGYPDNHDNEIQYTEEAPAADDEEKDEVSYTDNLTHAKWAKDLIDENFASERLFKLKVLDWLNDGKVKLIRTPGEGNYLVRLMDVSLTPNTVVGRMLHTFNATAYECAPFEYNAMVAHGIITPVPKEDIDDYVVQWRKIDYPSGSDKFSHHYYTAGEEYSVNLFQSNLGGGHTNYIEFRDWLPGSEFKLVTDPGAKSEYNGVFIKIGPTGTYILDDIQNVYGIYWHKPSKNNLYNNNVLANGGTIRYQYKDQLKDDFNLVSNIETDIGMTRQIVGLGLDKELAKGYLEVVDYESKHRIDLGNNGDDDRMPIEQVADICDIQLFKRPLYYVYYKGDNFNETGEMFETSGAGQQGKRDFIIDNKVWDNLYFDSYLQAPFKNQTFGEQDKYIMEYSPFGLFVVVNLDEKTEDMNYSILHSRLYSNSPTGYHDYGEGEEKETHNDHFGEGKVIDSWFAEMGPEEELFYKDEVLFYPDRPNDEECKKIIRSLKDEYYILDPWMNKIYKTERATERVEHLEKYDNGLINDMFDIVQQSDSSENGEKLEVSTYHMDLEDGDLKTLKLGVGIYAQVLYSKVTATLEPTDLDGSIKAKKEEWEAARATGDLVEERAKYGEYIEAVQSAVGEELAPNRNNYYMRPYSIKADMLDMLGEDEEDKLISFDEALKKLEQKFEDEEISEDEALEKLEEKFKNREISEEEYKKYKKGLNILKNWDINW